MGHIQPQHGNMRRAVKNDVCRMWVNIEIKFSGRRDISAAECRTTHQDNIFYIISEPWLFQHRHRNIGQWCCRTQSDFAGVGHHGINNKIHRMFF